MFLHKININYIKDKISDVLRLILPAGIIKLISYSLSKYNYHQDYHKYKGVLQKNIVFKNKNKGKRCFIIGNGPSLKEQDISLLKKEITFATNAFWKHPILGKSWQPTYYCLADPLYFKKNASDVDGCKTLKEFYGRLNDKINNCTFFVSISGFELIQKNDFIRKSKLYYFWLNDAYSNSEKYEIDLTSAIPAVQSVVQMAIEAAIYMSCNPIYLLGVDHNWLETPNISDSHFYDKKKNNSSSSISSGSTKSYYKNELESCLQLWQKYEKLLDLADKKGIKIYNATEGGFLDVFKRLRFEDVVGK